MPEEREPHELVNIPEDLALVNDADLGSLHGQAVSEFDRVGADPQVTSESVEYLMRLNAGIQRIRGEQETRRLRADASARDEQRRLNEQREMLATQVHGEGGAAAAVAIRTEDDDARLAELAARAAGQALVAAGYQDARGVGAAARRDVARRRPTPALPVPDRRLTVTAGVDIPGVARGGELPSIDAVVDAFHRRAHGLPDGHGTPNYLQAAVIRNEFEHTVDERTSPAQVEELFNYLTRGDLKEALVAGGGWCAPSEIRYDFFNIACSDGVIDLPTFGVARGGVRYPVSPSLADAIGANAFAPYAVAFSSASVPWLWTETDDIATVTGSPNKPVMRVPCPSFTETRLECYGVTLTAGNLTDDAYPEATRNTIRLLMAAHGHAMNARIIASMVALSSAAITGMGTTTDPVYQQVLGGTALAATDYRLRYGMCDSDVLEVIAPYWLREAIQADLAWRNGVELQSVTDAQIDGYFADRNARVQWVNDWQVRGSGQFGASTPKVVWPTSAQILVYAAGTFVKGNGLSLDLGVVRDSTLNAENDFTAAWSEECHLVARVGHESRLYTIPFQVGGGTGGTIATSAAHL